MGKIKYIMMGIFLYGGSITYAQTLKFTDQEVFILDTLVQDTTLVYHEENNTYVFEGITADSIIIKNIDGEALNAGEGKEFKIFEEGVLLPAFIRDREELNQYSIQHSQKENETPRPWIILKPGHDYTIQWHRPWTIRFPKRKKNPCSIKWLSADTLIISRDTLYKNEQSFAGSRLLGSWFRKIGFRGSDHFIVRDSVKIAAFDDETNLTVIVNDKTVSNPQDGFWFTKKDRVFIADGKHFANIRPVSSRCYEWWWLLLLPILGLGFYVVRLIRKQKQCREDIKLCRAKQSAFLMELKGLLEPESPSQENPESGGPGNKKEKTEEEGWDDEEKQVREAVQARLNELNLLKEEYGRKEMEEIKASNLLNRLHEQLKGLLKVEEINKESVEEAIQELANAVPAWLLRVLGMSATECNEATVESRLHEIAEKEVYFEAIFKLLRDFGVSGEIKPADAVERVRKSSYKFLFEDILRKYPGIADMVQEKPGEPYFVSLFESLKKRYSERPAGEADLEAVLHCPTVEQKSVIKAYLIKWINRVGFSIPPNGNPDGFMEEVFQKLSNIRSSTEVLKKAFESCDLAGAEDALLVYLLSQINLFIEKGKPGITAGQLTELYQKIAAKWSMPDDYAGAVREGKMQILEALRLVVGEVREEAVGEAVLSYHEQRVRQEITEKLEGLESIAKESVEKMVPILNEALKETASLHKYLEKYGADCLEKLDAKIVEKELAKVKETISKAQIQNAEVSWEEIEKKANKYKAIYSVVEQLLALVRAEATAKEKARKTLQENNHRIVETIVALKPEETEFEIDPGQAGVTVRNYGEAINSLVRQKNNENKTLTDAISQLNAKILQYKDGKAKDSVTIQAYHSAYLGLMEEVFNDIARATDGIYTGRDLSAPLAQMINRKILNNDVYSLTEFRKSLQTIIHPDVVETADTINGKLRNLYAECLSYDAPVWIDILVRMYAYARVPYIDGVFKNNGINVLNISAAYHLTRLMLNKLGIEISFPQLFKDLYDEEKYHLQPLNMVSTYFEDIFHSVDIISEDVVTDLYTVGFSVDGEVKKKPTVSRYN